MLFAETTITDTISLWGGIASIVALALTLLTGVYALFNLLWKSMQTEFEQLEKAQKELSDRIGAATTQGKRMDLFIYQQSLFTSLRFRHTILQIGVATQNLAGFLVIIWLSSLDRNADYAADHVFSFGNNWRENYPLLMFTTIAVVVLGMLSSRWLLRRQRRRIDSLSTTFISELKKIVYEKLMPSK